MDRGCAATHGPLRRHVHVSISAARRGGHEEQVLSLDPCAELVVDLVEDLRHRVPISLVGGGRIFASTPWTAKMRLPPSSPTESHPHGSRSHWSKRARPRRLRRARTRRARSRSPRKARAWRSSPATPRSSRRRQPYRRARDPGDVREAPTSSAPCGRRSMRSAGSTSSWRTAEALPPPSPRRSRAPTSRRRSGC